MTDRFLDHLAGADLFDCQGRTTHRLRLLPDGQVSIRYAAGHEVVVDPRTRRCRTPGFTVTDDLWREVVRLARSRP